MRNIIVLSILITLTGCVNFAASVGGTFVGNTAYDKIIKDKEKK
jgi:hypothetical protein